MSTVAGIQAVRETLRSSPKRVRKLVLRRGRADHRVRELISLARASGVPVYHESSEVLNRLAPRAHHQGVVAEISDITWAGFEELLASVGSRALLLALDHVEDPRNLGALARTAEGAGVQGIIVPHRGGAPPSAAAVTASAGALLHVPLARVTNLSAALERAKKAGIWVVGLQPRGGIPWFEFDYTVPVLIVVGSEGRGLRRRVAATCDAGVFLPQRGRVESLNVSVAAGIVLYEAVRQRVELSGETN